MKAAYLVVIYEGCDYLVVFVALEAFVKDVFVKDVTIVAFL